MKKLFLVISTFLVTVNGYSSSPLNSYSTSAPEGNYEINIGWGLNEFGNDVLVSKISFSPKNISCKKTGFIQIAKVVTNDGKDFIWSKSSGQETRNVLKNKNNWFVDYNPLNCHDGHCSPFYIDHWKEEGTFGSEKIITKMADYPFGWSDFKEIQLEACLVCADSMETFRCIQYGGLWDLTHDKTTLPVSFAKPSSNFSESLYLFKSHYSKK